MLRELSLLQPYLQRYRRYFVVGSVCVAATLYLKVQIPRWLGGAVDELRTMGEDPSPALAESLRAAVTETALLIVGAALGAALVRTTSRLLILGVSRRAVHDVREDVFDALLGLSPSFYDRTPTGHLMSRCVNDVQNVQGLLGPVFMYTLETILLYVFALTMMVAADPTLSLLGILPFPFFLHYARKQALEIHKGSRASQAKLGEISSKVDESLSGHHVIKTLAIEEADAARFEARCAEFRTINLGVTRARARILPMMIALGSLCSLLVLAVGGPRVIRGELSLGKLLQVMLYLQMMAQPTGTLGFVISSFQRGAAALGRLREVLEMERDLVDPSPLPPARGGAGRLEVRGLTLAFPALHQVPHLSGTIPDPVPGAAVEDDSARTVLRDVDLVVPAGSTLGVTGHTGSGKTTLLRALARQLEVPAGTVFLDGEDVNELGLAEVRGRIGFVPQETFLFSRTLAENVALGDPRASSERVAAAVRSAHLEKDLEQLPHGLETLLGERGVNLSGGQRQRTALARVLLLDPDVLILDDALSAVDAHTSDEILRDLRPVLSGRTSIVAAHRLATLQHADQIVVLEEGRIVERGSHVALMEQGGRYARLWRHQALQSAAEEEWARTEQPEDEEAHR